MQVSFHTCLCVSFVTSWIWKEESYVSQALSWGTESVLGYNWLEVSAVLFTSSNTYHIHLLLKLSLLYSYLWTLLWARREKKSCKISAFPWETSHLSLSSLEQQISVLATLWNTHILFWLFLLLHVINKAKYKLKPEMIQTSGWSIF